MEQSMEFLWNALTVVAIVTAGSFSIIVMADVVMEYFGGKK